MKLLYCPVCEDLFKLTFRPRSCQCGIVTGHYENTSQAVTNGAGVSVAIGNGSLHLAIGRMLAAEGGDRKSFQETGSLIAWVRPNEGPGNPHTRIERERKTA